MKNKNKNSVAVILVSSNGELLLQHRDNIKSIEYPDYWCFIGGWIEDKESHQEAAIREINEELSINGESTIKRTSLRFIYECNRIDRPWTEFVYCVEIESSVNSILLNEGQAIGEFKIEECLSLVRLAPHHKLHLDYLISNLTKIKGIRINLDIINIKTSMKKIKDYLELTKLGNVKDYKALEVGDGYILSSECRPVGVIHTKESAKLIALLVFAKDIPWGFHYHFEKIEYLTVLSGKLKCEFSLPDNLKEKYEFILEEGQQIRILPGCVHTYTAIDSDVYTLEYAPNRYKESDVVVVDN